MKWAFWMFIINIIYVIVNDLNTIYVSSTHFLYTCFRLWRYQDEVDTYSSRIESDERGRGRERGRDRREKCRDSENGRSSRRQSTSSLHTQVRCCHCRYRNEIHVETAPFVILLFILSKSPGNQSGKHRSLKVKERSPIERPQTEVRTVPLLSPSV